jgi:hypothetical protein
MAFPVSGVTLVDLREERPGPPVMHRRISQHVPGHSTLVGVRVEVVRREGELCQFE